MIFAALLLASCHLVRGQNNPPNGKFAVLAAVGGWEPHEDQYRWAVGVHKINEDGNFEHICGGSLISTKIVLSAAHCFWNNGRDVPLRQYLISAGNFYRDLNRDARTQKMEIEDVVFHERYRGYDLNYAHDIVIVVLYQEVILNNYITPIAIDWDEYFEDNYLKGFHGTVVGWGFTEQDVPSETRIAVNLPFVDFDQCYDVVPRDFRSSLTPDKFCAGLRNGTAVCPGDSGGGLAFLNSQEMTWYLRGIVSVGVSSRDKSKCNKTQYSAFTSISHYRTWLEHKLRALQRRYRPTERYEYRQENSGDVFVFV